jgi:hypothetical protein
VIGFYLVFHGHPRACTDRAVAFSPSATLDLVRDWAMLATGPSAITVTEVEATSFAQVYLENRRVKADDVQVHFCPDGTAEASGKVAARGLTAHVLVKGRLAVGGAAPAIEVYSVRAGSLPDAIARRLIDPALSRARLQELGLPGHIEGVDYHDASITIRGGP